MKKWKTENKPQRPQRYTLWTHKKYLLKNKTVKRILYAVESYSLPGSEDVKCDYEEVIA